jgi:hypothetical protein
VRRERRCESRELDADGDVGVPLFLGNRGGGMSFGSSGLLAGIASVLAIENLGVGTLALLRSRTAVNHEARTELQLLGTTGFSFLCHLAFSWRHRLRPGALGAVGSGSTKSVCEAVAACGYPSCRQHC